MSVSVKTKAVTKFGITVTITYDPKKTDEAALAILVKDAEVSCVRIRNKRGY